MTTEMKVILVGDVGVGKTCLGMVYTSNTFPSDHVPTSFDSYSTSIIIEDKTILLNLLDTAGSEEFETLRPLAYPGTDVFLVCFSLIEPETLAHVKTKWVPEIRTHTEGEDNAIILVGTKLDQRDNPDVLAKLHEHGANPVSPGEGKHMADEIGAVSYCECSALTQEGLQEMFNAAVRHVFDKKFPKQKEEKTDPKPSSRSCVIM